MPPTPRQEFLLVRVSIPGMCQMYGGTDREYSCMAALSCSYTAHNSLSYLLWTHVFGLVHSAQKN